jgi:hypothetical protein
MEKTHAAVSLGGMLGRRPMVEAFLVATRPLLRLLRAGRPLTPVEEDLIATKIGSLRVDFTNWKRKRTRMPL